MIGVARGISPLSKVNVGKHVTLCVDVSLLIVVGLRKGSGCQLTITYINEVHLPLLNEPNYTV